MRYVLMGIIRIYQLVVSPLLGPRCRFHPSCSCYAHTAIERYGVLRGSWLGAKRLFRCHPFSEGGYDPVPDKRSINA
jgi:putative membrane protein insertion efficiency factor